MNRVLLVLSLAAGLATAACGNTSAAGPGGTSGGGGGRGGRGRGDTGVAPIVTAKVSQKDVPVDIASIGNVEAYTTISVRSQVTGVLEQAFFKEGDFVKKDAELFTIDRRPFEAALAMAQANDVRNKALLEQAKAQLARDAANAEYQQLTSERQVQLQQRGIISKDLADQARSQADASTALVNADKANVQSAQANLDAGAAATETARVQLSYTSIKSPVDGRTGTLSVKPGNLVTANNTELMTIAQVQPVFVTFTVPAVNLPTVKKHMTDNTLQVTAIPQDNDAQPAVGHLTFVENAVDTTTDTIKLKATFENPDRRMWPGQFARVSLRLTTITNATVVPTQAVQTGQDGQYVFVVKGDNTVEQRTVTPGQHVDQDTVIEKGLQPGEVVVTEGQLRLENGSKVTTDLNAAPGGGGRGRGGNRGGGNRGGGRQGS
ncbi:MAG TPA: efflux RND transporter periplasmic adaptor subunit [Vicinamibacterales bacterium]|nr:efflux RND transporter periplasmic adaptor subunit [Vicinamibacterales bacterium]